MRVENSQGDDLLFSLMDGYPAWRLLDGFAKRRGVSAWTPLILAQALADFKSRVGGTTRVVSAGDDFIELSQTKCEFGEPKPGALRGNMCGVCNSVLHAAARFSGIADPRNPPRFRTTIAGGWKSCSYTVPLT